MMSLKVFNAVNEQLLCQPLKSKISIADRPCSQVLAILLVEDIRAPHHLEHELLLI